jgi:hypothetical protein
LGGWRATSVTTLETARLHGVDARNARLEAQEVVGGRFEPRVLEPSPPAVIDDEWFADDPVAVDDAARSRPVVSAVATGDLSWDEWLGTRPEHATWAAARWLGAFRRLPAPPPTLAEARLAMHRLAVYVVSPARRRVNGKLGLRWTLGGFGTPFFGGDEQVRVVGAQLVRQQGEAAKAEPITTLAAAGALVLDGPPDAGSAEGFDVPPIGDLDEELAVDPVSADFLGDWYGFAYSVLEELRADRGSVEATRVQLWPEHFDAAVDCLPADRRATFGASPGDAAVAEPYLYVLPWHVDDARSVLWNAQTFRGAILPLSALVAEPDQRAAAVQFFGERHAALRA